MLVLFQKITSSHIPILFSGSSLWAKYVAAVKAREVASKFHLQLFAYPGLLVYFLFGMV